MRSQNINKWNLRGWKLEPNYSPRTLVGDWYEERRTVSWTLSSQTLFFYVLDQHFFYLFSLNVLQCGFITNGLFNLTTVSKIYILHCFSFPYSLIARVFRLCPPIKWTTKTVHLVVIGVHCGALNVNRRLVYSYYTVLFVLESSLSVT